MKKKDFFLWVFISAVVLSGCTGITAPLSLNPENPHYFLFRGKPAILIGSTEHYGAVLNPEFNYKKYLDELSSKGLNITRTFSGIYVEPQRAFGIANNTLAPRNGKLICPWARSSTPGYSGGGNKFDLSEWDEAYFVRLKDFISEAGKRDIVVELDLFSNFYDTIQWKLSPLNIQNNINKTEEIRDHKEVLSMRHPEIIAVQENMVRKIVNELKDFDNLYYEICNEPYFGDIEALNVWEAHMTYVVAEAEKAFPFKHLISNNIGNGSEKIGNPDPGVSIFNFHYCKPPYAVSLNFNLDKVIGDNETGFNGIEDINYRTEAWDFLTAGGALFNNLDYSFATGHEDGTFEVAEGQPGGGGIMLRSQLSALKQVFNELDFLKMRPSDEVAKINGDTLCTIRVLAEEGVKYLVYLNNIKAVKGKSATAKPQEILISVTGGSYEGVWIDPLTGIRKSFSSDESQNGVLTITTPAFTEDMALLLTKK